MQKGPWPGTPALFTTQNGGASWTETGADSFDAPSRIVTRDGTHGVMIDGSLYYTGDGGNTWEYGTVHSDLGSCAGFYDVAMVNSQKGWFACNPWDDDTILVGRTTDGGANWQVTARVSATDRGCNPQVAFQDDEKGWLGGDQDGNLWETNDGGSTWQPAPDGIQPLLPFGSLDVGANGRGWAAVPSGALLRFAPLVNLATVTPQGGMLASPDGGRLQVEFTAGSVSTDTEALLEVYEPAPAGDRFTQSLYQLALAPDVSLGQPVTLTAQLDTAGAGVSAAGSQDEEPQLAHLDDSTWVPLSDGRYDPATDELCGTTQETGFFAVLVPAHRIYLPVIRR